MPITMVSFFASLDISQAQYLPELTNSTNAGMAIGATLALTLLFAIIIFLRSLKVRSRQSSMQLTKNHLSSERLGPNTTAPRPVPPVMAEPEVLRDLMVSSPAHEHVFEPEIYQHPYVKKLEDRIHRLGMKYEAQVRRTEEFQLKALEHLVELHGMVLIGQSKTLADFMQQAEHWMVGSEPRDAKGPDEHTPTV